MSPWMRVVGITVGSVAAAAAVAIIVGTLSWHRAIARAVVQLGRPAPTVSTGDGTVAPAFSPTQLAGLPAPVVRYFMFALRPGQPFIRRARLRWTGEFLVKPGGAWSPFTADQHYGVHPPGFVWDATIRMASLLPVRVRDSYFGGEGALQAKLAALVPLADQRGTPEMASGELLRYLAEAVWLPTALLPSEGVSWTAIDNWTARATLTDGGTTVSLDVQFGAQGEIVSASANRYRLAAGTAVLTPWVGHYRDYARADGMMVPMVAEVEWVLPEQRLPYWRGRIVGVEYAFVP
jgi:hypothetical protein